MTLDVLALLDAIRAHPTEHQPRRMLIDACEEGADAVRQTIADLMDRDPELTRTRPVSASLSGAAPHR